MCGIWFCHPVLAFMKCLRAELKTSSSILCIIILLLTEESLSPINTVRVQHCPSQLAAKWSAFFTGRSLSLLDRCCRFLPVSSPYPQGNQPPQVLLCRRLNNSQQSSFFWCFIMLLLCYNSRGLVIHRLPNMSLWAIIKALKVCMFLFHLQKRTNLSPQMFVRACTFESHPEQQNFLIPSTPPRLLKMENCSLFSPTHASHSTFVSNTQHLYLSGSRAGCKHHRCSSKYSA